ncbi:MAG: hypothetical protein IPM82_23270 [Saprospiraceae bacterium]|nr:hypothetical protein [Saprospiraceae bacterium]
MAEINFNISTIKRPVLPNSLPSPAPVSLIWEAAAFLPSPTPTIAAMTTLRDVYQGKEADFKIPSEANKQLRDDAYEALIKAIFPG